MVIAQFASCKRWPEGKHKLFWREDGLAMACFKWAMDCPRNWEATSTMILTSDISWDDPPSIWQSRWSVGLAMAMAMARYFDGHVWYPTQPTKFALTSGHPKLALMNGSKTMWRMDFAMYQIYYPIVSEFLGTEAGHGQGKLFSIRTASQLCRRRPVWFR